MLIGTYGGPPGKVLRPLKPGSSGASGEKPGSPILQIANAVDGSDWVYSCGAMPAAGTLDELHFGVVLTDLVDEYCASINPDEGQRLITREVGRRMRGLTSSGVASGSLSELWGQQYGFFKRQRDLLHRFER